jgi:hypothetical protein
LAKLDVPIRISSEADAWLTLRRLIDDEIDADDVDLNSSSFAWASIDLHAKGEKYHSSLPTAFMRGLVEFQDNFLRSSALILKDSSHITKLPNDARADLDLVFVVSEGTTGIKSILEGPIGEIVKRLGDKLTGKQIVILVLALAAMYGGFQTYKLHLQHALEIEKLEDDAEEDQQYRSIIEQLIESDQDAAIEDTLNKAAKNDKRVHQISELASAGRDALLSHAADVDVVTVQGISLSKAVLVDLNRRSRRRSEEVTFTELAKIEAIDAAEAHHFRVKIRRKSGPPINAYIRDIEENRRTLNALWKAESSRKQIMVELTGRQIGRDLRDAKVRRAWTPRKKS